MLGAHDLQHFQRDGYLVIGQPFSLDEMEQYRDHLMRLRGRGRYPGALAAVDPTSDDSLKRYPRMIHRHRWDELSFPALQMDDRPAAFVPEEA